MNSEPKFSSSGQQASAIGTVGTPKTDEPFLLASRIFGTLHWVLISSNHIPAARRVTTLRMKVNQKHTKGMRRLAFVSRIRQTALMGQQIQGTCW